MTYIQWSDGLSVGVEVIDNQHQRLIDYINELHDVIQGHASTKDHKERLMSIVNELVDYTESHFGFEEALMEEARYPYLKAHMRVHQLLVRRAGEYKERLLKGEDIAAELLETLNHWLLNHIKNEDQDYAKWLNTPNENVPVVTNNQGWLKRQLERFFGK